MNICILGYSGKIGSNLLNKLKENKNNIILISREKKEEINKYRYIYKMQRRRRRNLTYKKKRTQLAYKNLALSKLLDTYDVDNPLTRHMRRETIHSIMDY